MTWRVVDGQVQVDLSNDTVRGDALVDVGADTTAKVETTAGSVSVNDVNIQLFVNARLAGEHKMTVMQPKVMTITGFEDNAVGNGFETIAHMKVLDQFGVVLPNPVETNEKFVPPAGAAPDGFASNWAGGMDDWGHAAPNGQLSSPADKRDQFTDDPDATMPTPVNPGAAGAGETVDYTTQEWYCGDTTPGSGVQIASWKLQFYRGKARSGL